MDLIKSETIETLKTWISNRVPNERYHTNVVIHPSSKFHSLGFPDLVLDRFSPSPSKCDPSLDLKHFLEAIGKFTSLLREQRSQLEALEILRTNFNQKLAQLRVQEAIDLLRSSRAMESALHVEIGGYNSIPIEQADMAIDEILSKVLISLLSSCSARLVVEPTQYGTSLLVAFLVDTMHQAGLRQDQLSLFSYDVSPDWSTRPKSYLTPRLPKLSTVGVFFGDFLDLPKASKCSIEWYLRDTRYRNQILLVEECIYETFCVYWRYNESLLIGATIDIKVDFNCLDVKMAHRKTGPCISIIKFRSVNELSELLSKLRIPRMQIWTEDYLLARELSLSSDKFNQCFEFWLNHLPSSRAARQFRDRFSEEYKSMMREHMDIVYSEVALRYAKELEQVRRKPITRRQYRTLISVYLRLISKFKSGRQKNASVSESVAAMRRFQISTLSSIHERKEESLIETVLKPVGLALLVVRHESCISSKATLIEFIFKNLLIGNSVLLICAPSLLGVRFPMDVFTEHKLPFRMVELKSQEGLSPSGQEACCSGDESTSWESSTDSGLNTPLPTIKCPEDAYAVELHLGKLNSNDVETLVLGLGSRRKRLWLPSGFQQYSMDSEASDCDE